MGGDVVETRDLKTDVNAADFELPQGYQQFSPEEVRQQVAQLGQLLQGVIAFINSQQAVTTPTATPGCWEHG